MPESIQKPFIPLFFLISAKGKQRYQELAVPSLFADDVSVSLGRRTTVFAIKLLLLFPFFVVLDSRGCDVVAELVSAISERCTVLHTCFCCVHREQAEALGWLDQVK